MFTDDDIKRKKRDVDAVAVHALMKQQSIDHIGELHTLRLDTVLLNEGNAFLEHSGVFHAPVTGVYVFSASVMSRYRAIQCSIMKNGVANGRTSANDAYDQGSVTPRC